MKPTEVSGQHHAYPYCDTNNWSSGLKGDSSYLLQQATTMHYHLLPLYTAVATYLIYTVGPELTSQSYGKRIGRSEG